MDLIFQNNGDRRMWIVSGITPAEQNHLIIKFTDLELPADAPEGEYTYALIVNEYGSAVTYNLKTDLLDTEVTYNDKTYILRDLAPITGLMRIGGVPTEKNIYQRKNKNYYYKG